VDELNGGGESSAALNPNQRGARAATVVRSGRTWPLNREAGCMVIIPHISRGVTLRGRGLTV